MNDDDSNEYDWRDFKREGKGIYYWNDGGIFQGYFKDDKREGKEILYFNDGDRYEGDFKDGKEGKGIL